MASQTLLEMHLRQLRLPTFIQNYASFAQDATRANLSYERYLLALCDAEVAQREANRVERAIAAARFPVQKELSSFDFSVVQNVSKSNLCNNCFKSSCCSQMPGRETSVKQIHPSLASQAQSQESCPDPIHPTKVWTTLTPTQQHNLLQTLVLMCQDCLLPGKETGQDPACPLVENYPHPS